MTALPQARSLESLEETIRLVQSTLLGDAVQSAGVAVFISDEYGGRLVAVNEAACTLLGYSRSELLALTARELSAARAVELDGMYAEVASAGSISGLARLRHAEGGVVEIPYATTQTEVAGMAFLLTVTAPVGTARTV